MTAADAFISSKPVVYSGFDGRIYVATYRNGEKNGLGIGSLEIRTGKSFFLNIDAEAA